MRAYAAPAPGTRPPRRRASPTPRQRPVSWDENGVEATLATAPAPTTRGRSAAGRWPEATVRSPMLRHVTAASAIRITSGAAASAYAGPASRPTSGPASSAPPSATGKPSPCWRARSVDRDAHPLGCPTAAASAREERLREHLERDANQHDHAVRGLVHPHLRVGPQHTEHDLVGLEIDRHHQQRRRERSRLAHAVAASASTSTRSASGP